MTDAAQVSPPSNATDTNPTDAAQTQTEVVQVPDLTATTERAPANAPAPAPGGAGRGNALRALRDRIALRRSLGTKHKSLSSPTLLSSGPEQSLLNAREDTIPSKRVPFGRFIHGKLGGKKGGKKAKEGAGSPNAAPIPVAFDIARSTSSASTAPEDSEALPTIQESEAPPSAPVQEAEVVTEAAAVATGPDSERLPLARKIQSLLSSLPPFLSTFEPPSSNSGDQTNQGSGDSAGGAGASPAPGQGPPSATISDSRLFSLLSSPAIMNGSLGRGQQSIWAMLDNLRLNALKSNAAEVAPTPDAADGELEGVLEDDDSVMFYGPLVPNEGSLVELARSEIVSVDENGTIVGVLVDDAPLPEVSTSRPSSPAASGALKTEGFSWPWPFHRDTPPASPSKPKLVEKRMWVPSTTQLSLQVMWWGFRIWLPPPVLTQLNSKEIEVAKLGAMLTAALQWLLNNVPLSALPPTLQPALQLVRSIVPYLGYIGGFVAWSWSELMGFDIGNGVTLTATWLLPIALIPGTWENADVPKPPATGDPSAPSSSSPAPSTSTPSVPAAAPSAPSTGNASAPSAPSTVPTADSILSAEPAKLRAA